MTFYLVLFFGDIDHLKDLAWIRQYCKYPDNVGLLKEAIAHMKN